MSRVLTTDALRRKARLALLARARLRVPGYVLPRDGDGDGFYSPRPGMPDKTPVPPQFRQAAGARTAAKARGVAKVPAITAQHRTAPTRRRSASSRVASLPRLPRRESPQQAAKATNPRFGTTSSNPHYYPHRRWTPRLGPRLPNGAYENNCTNVVVAWELRMRGYDVQAAPYLNLDVFGYVAGRTYDELDEFISRAWTLPDGRPHGRSFAGQPWRTFDDVDAEILRTWPDGARGVIFVGRHIFNVIKTGGRVHYIEAQFDATPDRIVTEQYRAKFAITGRPGEDNGAKLIRLDDLVPADGIFEAIVPIR